MTSYLHILSTANALIAFATLYLVFVKPAYANDRDGLLNRSSQIVDAQYSSASMG